MFERLKSLIGGANIAGAAAVKKKTITDIGREVIAGDWGSGDERIAELKRKGYNPDEVQKEVNRLLSCRELIIQNMRAWAIKTSAEPYRYVYWTEPYGHECAKCHPHGGKNKGWQCIGWAIACWHHGGLPIPCNCGVLDNGTCERILKAKTDAEALKIAQKELKIKDIKVIRNGGDLIPKSWVQPGDIGALFTGNVFQHLIMFMGNDKLTDSTQGRTDADDIRADRKFSGRYVTRLKLLIRYTGKGLTKPEKKTVDELAHEVLDDMWYSGDVRKRALTECNYDYDAVQKRVDEILNPPKTSSTIKIGQATKDYDGKAGDSSGKEVTKSNFSYSSSSTSAYNWTYVFRPKDSTKAEKSASMCEKAIANNNIGYSKNGETEYGKDRAMTKLAKAVDYDLSKISTKCGLSCGDLICLCNQYAGLSTCYIGSALPLAEKLKENKNFTCLSYKKGMELKRGDVLITAHSNGKNNHVAMVLVGTKPAPKPSKKGYTGAYPTVAEIKKETKRNYLKKGDKGESVKKLQKYLNWYSDGKFFEESGNADGIYGANTLKWCKKFQEKELGKGEGDGTVGKKTIAAMKKVKK